MTEFVVPHVLNEKPTIKEIQAAHGFRGPVHSYIKKRWKLVYTRCRLAEAQNWKCCWCGKECRPEPGYRNSVSLEHIVPRSEGGTDDIENLAMACVRCNNKRGTVGIEEFMERFNAA